MQRLVLLGTGLRGRNYPTAWQFIYIYGTKVFYILEAVCKLAFIRPNVRQVFIEIIRRELEGDGRIIIIYDYTKMLRAALKKCQIGPEISEQKAAAGPSVDGGDVSGPTAG